MKEDEKREEIKVYGWKQGKNESSRGWGKEKWKGKKREEKEGKENIKRKKGG